MNVKLGCRGPLHVHLMLHIHTLHGYFLYNPHLLPVTHMHSHLPMLLLAIVFRSSQSIPSQSVLFGYLMQDAQAKFISTYHFFQYDGCALIHVCICVCLN